MADRRLRQVEELVQASVFHPSPCRRLRERVVHKAEQAMHRQRLGRRTAIASAFAIGLIVFPLVVMRLWFSTSAVTTPQPQAVIVPVGTDSGLRPAYPATPYPSSSLQSPGEALLYGAPVQRVDVSTPNPMRKASGGL